VNLAGLRGWSEAVVGDEAKEDMNAIAVPEPTARPIRIL
jgi:hypothetical protein